MLFQKQDMEGNHYTWQQDGEKQVFLGQPSRRMFDRFNGDQVLFLINFLGSLSEGFTLQQGKKIEYEIFNNLPTDKKSEMSVFNWIREAGVV
jgi:hypothetical protein